MLSTLLFLLSLFTAGWSFCSLSGSLIRGRGVWHQVRYQYVVFTVSIRAAISLVFTLLLCMKSFIRSSFLVVLGKQAFCFSITLGPRTMLGAFWVSTQWRPRNWSTLIKGPTAKSDRNFKLHSGTYHLCDLGQVKYPFCTSVFSQVNTDRSNTYTN